MIAADVWRAVTQLRCTILWSGLLRQWLDKRVALTMFARRLPNDTEFRAVGTRWERTVSDQRKLNHYIWAAHVRFLIIVVILVSCYVCNS